MLECHAVHGDILLRIDFDLLFEQANVAVFVKHQVGEELEVGVVDFDFGGVDGAVRSRYRDGGCVAVTGDVTDGDGTTEPCKLISGGLAAAV